MADNTDNTTTTTTTQQVSVKVGDIVDQIEIASKLDVLTDMFWIQTKGDNQNNPQTVFIPAQWLIAYLRTNITATKDLMATYNKLVAAEAQYAENEAERQKNEEQRQSDFSDSQTTHQNEFDSAQTTRQETFDASLQQWNTTFTDSQTSRQSDYEAKEKQRQEDFEANEKQRQETFDTDETNRQNAFDANEADRQAKANNALAVTEDINQHPGYPGADGYWYKYNSSTKTYTKTDVLLKGDSFKITKQYKSVAAMQADDVTQYAENSFMLINTGDTEDEDDAKLYVVDLDASGNKQYDFLCDMSGFRGFTGKTPQISIGTVTTLDEDGTASASLSENGTDTDGNPKFLLNFAIPRGKAMTYADLTAEQIAELQKPATDAAAEAKEATAKTEQATATANEKIATMESLETTFNEKEAARQDTFEANEKQRQTDHDNKEKDRQADHDKHETENTTDHNTRESNMQEDYNAKEKERTANSEAAVTKANNAAANADEKAQTAQDAADKVDAKLEELETLAQQVAAGAVCAPTAMTISYPAELARNNSVEQKITVELTPSFYPKNVIYQIAEGNSVGVNPSGKLSIKGTGITKIWVIPTNNTELWQEATINVRNGRMLKVNSGFLKVNGKFLSV